MHKRILTSLVLLLMACGISVQTARAQQEILVSYHHKVNGTTLSPNSSPEDVANYVIGNSGRNSTLMPGMSMTSIGQKVDACGNVHVGYGMMKGTEETYYQLFLHFRPDGTLYFINGKVPLLDLDLDSPAKSKVARKKIPAERAALIATGNSSSRVVETVVTYKDKPCVAYKVNDPGTLQEVYVDVYSGEVIYTITHAHSYSALGDVNGTYASVQGNTLYYGMQTIDALKTAEGYILRDPVRNIITVNATDKYKDLPDDDFPGGDLQQINMLVNGSDDFVYDEEQLQNAEYATAIRSLQLSYFPEDWDEAMPVSTTIRGYYTDTEWNPLDDFLNIDNVTWTKEAWGAYEYELSLPEPVSVDLFSKPHVVEIKINDKVYTLFAPLAASDKTFKAAQAGDSQNSDLVYQFDIAANAMQPALDIHWSIQKTYDMYDTYFGIKGSDGEGCQLVNIVNPSNNIPFMNGQGCPANAFAITQPMVDSYNNKTFHMVYGMGQILGGCKPLVELPIIAHEFTHTVTAGCGNNLLYLAESGALNEATADCMAMVAEDFAVGQPSWFIGAKASIVFANMRDFKDPWYSGCAGGNIYEQSAQPKYYGGRYWFDYIADPTTDAGGVHTNSGVFNHAFYLLCEGAQNITNEMGQTHTIEPIGMDRMKDILFHSMFYYNSSLCDYAEIADNLMIAIEDIMPQDENTIARLQESMSVAFEHVGMKTSFFPTGITTVSSDAKSPYSGTYNLYGMPVDGSYKGVVIRNGKKVIRK